jgi:hypothetical protein
LRSPRATPGPGSDWQIATASRICSLADIPQMGFGPTQNLTRFLFFDKPRCRRGLFERVVAGRVAIGGSNIAEFAVIKTYLSLGFCSNA